MDNTATRQQASNFVEAVGRRLAELRQQKGWSRDELAFHSDASKTSIRCIEVGEQNPTIGILYSLAVALDVPLEELLNVEH